MARFTRREIEEVVKKEEEGERACLRFGGGKKKGEMATRDFINGILSFYAPRQPDGVEVIEVNRALVSRLWMFYLHDDVCGRCRNIVAGMIQRDMILNAKWEGRQLKPAYKELLREPLTVMFDLLITVGFAPWRWITVMDETGQPQVIPYIMSPDAGEFKMFWKEDVLLYMKFITTESGVAGKVQQRSYDVAMLRAFAPERSGALRSPLANMHMRLFRCSTIENAEAQVAHVRARPPQVVEQPGDSFLSQQAVEEYMENGGDTDTRGHTDELAIARQQKAREHAAKELDDSMAGGAAAVIAPGHDMHAPDPFTGTWPDGRTRGPLHGNMKTMPAGCKVGRCEPAAVVVDAEAKRAQVERALCTVFGVSSTLLYPDNTSSRFKSSVDDAKKITCDLSIKNLGWAALMLQGVMNRMFQAADSARIAIEAMRAATEAGAIPEKIGKNAARAIARTNRYILEVSFPQTASPEELRALRYDGAITSAEYNRLNELHFNMEPGTLAGDGVPLGKPAAESGGGPPPKKKTAKRDDADKS